MTEQQLDTHENFFREHGYTVVPGLNADRVAMWREAILESHGREGSPGDDVSGTGPSWLNERPALVLPYVASDDLLDLVERLMGPFVGLAGQGSKVSLSRPVEEAGRFRVWHRDMWPVPGWTNDYLPPNGINVLTYLQQGDEYGPLYVIPGSHRRHIPISDEEAVAPHRDELAVKVDAGDTILVHSTLLHSEGGNHSDELRLLVFAFLTKCWLPKKSHYHGPAIDALLQDARSRNDRRVIRLFEPDQDELISRAKMFHGHVPDGCAISERDMWIRWVAEDRDVRRGPLDLERVLSSYPARQRV